MMITDATLAALRVMVDTRFQDVFAGTEAWSDTLATHVTMSAGPVGVYPFTGDQLALREWIGPRMAQTMTERKYQLENKEYEGTLEIPRTAILDDALGYFEAAIVPGFAEAMRKWPDQEIATRIFGLNPNGFDGVPFFDDSHPTFNGSSTYDNDHTISPYDADGNFSYAVFAQELDTIRGTAMTTVGESGRIMMTGPFSLVVPPQWEIRAKTLVNSAVIPTPDGNFVDNQWRGVFPSVIVIPEIGITDSRYPGLSPNTIYLMDLSRAMKPILWQERSSPVLKSFADGSQESHVRDNKFTWYVDGSDGGPYRAAPGVSLPFLAHRIAIADPPT